MIVQVTPAEVNQRLLELADDPAFVRRAEDLRSLAGAVTDPDDDSWTGMDLCSSFPSSSTLTSGHGSAVERLLGMLSPVAVFLPVAWTWWSLRQATSAYQELIGAGGEKGRTFLALWTGGFDGRLAQTHRLVEMALVSVLLIVLAVALIVAHRMVAQSNLRREDEEHARKEAALVSALTATQRTLNERRSDDPDRIESLVKRSVRELRAAHEKTRAGASQLQAAGEQLRDTITAAQQTTADLAAFVMSAERAHANVTSTLASVHSQLNSSLDVLRTSLTATTEDLQAATTKAVAALSADVSRVAGTHSDLGAGIAALTESQVRVGHAIGRLDDSLERHESALQGQASELTAARDAAERMLRHLEQVVAPQAPNGATV